MKTYTEEQLKQAYRDGAFGVSNEINSCGTVPAISAEEYIKTVSLSEREQPRKDGFEEWMEKEISLMNPQGKKMLNYIRVLTKYRTLSPCKEKWISVETDLPKGRYVQILVFNGSAPLYNQHVFQANWFDESKVFKTEVNYLGEITHWIPLPSPPTGDNKKGEEGE